MIFAKNLPSLALNYKLRLGVLYKDKSSYLSLLRMISCFTMAINIQTFPPSSLTFAQLAGRQS